MTMESRLHFVRLPAKTAVLAHCKPLLLPVLAAILLAGTVSADEAPFQLNSQVLFGGDGDTPSWLQLPTENWTLEGEPAEVWWPKNSSPPSGWDGLGRFTLQVDVADDLVGVPLACLVEQRGAFELRIDGRLVDAAGSLPGTMLESLPNHHDGFRPRNQPGPSVFSFERAGVQAVEVAYGNPRVSAFHRNGHAGGFRLTLAPANYGVRTTAEIDARSGRYQGLFTGVFLAVAMLHLLLFIFWPETRENLWFSLLCVSVAVLEGCLFN